MEHTASPLLFAPELCLYRVSIPNIISLTTYTSVDSYRRMLVRCFCCCFLTLLLSSIVCEAITRQEFFGYNYLFNTINGSLPKELDGISYVNVTPYDVLFPFFGEKYEGLQVSVRVRRYIDQLSGIWQCSLVFKSLECSFGLHARA